MTGEEILRVARWAAGRAEKVRANRSDVIQTIALKLCEAKPVSLEHARNLARWWGKAHVNRRARKHRYATQYAANLPLPGDLLASLCYREDPEPRIKRGQWLAALPDRFTTPQAVQVLIGDLYSSQMLEYKRVHRRLLRAVRTGELSREGLTWTKK